MSTIERREPVTVPPLIAGERLDRATFHERYEAMPPQTRAELIGGVVHMPSPLSLDHGWNNAPVVFWLMHYQRSTKGVRTAINASTFLGEDAETQPDVLMMIPPEIGGRTRREGKYLAGGPELVVEIARSSRRIDLGPKYRDYERAGVLEYLVVALDPDEIHWFVRRDDRFATAHARPGWALPFRGLPRALARSAGALRRRPGWAHHHARPRPRDPRTCGIRRTARPGSST